MRHGVVPDRLAEGTRIGLAPLARRLHAVGVTADGVTIAGMLVTIAGAALLATDHPVPALLVLVAGTLMDTLDGAIARAAGGGSRFGAFLDSTADRVSDGAIASGIVALGAARTDPWLVWGALVGLVASFLVSYTRAKAESLGIRATVGVAPREARILILLAGLALWVAGLPALFTAAVAAVAILSTITLLQRVAHVARALGDQ